MSKGDLFERGGGGGGQVEEEERNSSALPTGRGFWGSMETIRFDNFVQWSIEFQMTLFNWNFNCISREGSTKIQIFW